MVNGNLDLNHTILDLTHSVAIRLERGLLQNWRRTTKWIHLAMAMIARLCLCLSDVINTYQYTRNYRVATSYASFHADSIFLVTVFVCGCRPCLYSRQTTNSTAAHKIDTRRPRWYAYIIQIIQVWANCSRRFVTLGAPILPGKTTLYLQ